MTKLRQYLQPLIILIIFETVAVTLWLTKNNLFYLFNFSYIGLSISLGIFLFINKYKYARRIVQLLVGLYMLVYLGLICRENMQIEGFWYYLQLPKYSAPWYLDAAGAAMPAGRQWYWIFFPTRSRRSRGRRLDGYAILHLSCHSFSYQHYSLQKSET